MAVLISRPQQSYGPQTVTIPFTVAANVKLILFRATRVGWPAGVVANCRLVWNNGEESSATFIGDGSSDAKVGEGKPVGVTSGTAFFEVVQTATSAVTVETF